MIDDDRKGPPRRAESVVSETRRKIAAQRGDDRDFYRLKTPPPPRQDDSPQFISDEVTGKYEGEELQRIRGLRPTDMRIGRLEDKHDHLASVVSDLREEVGNVSGKLDVLPDLVKAVQDSADRMAQREHVSYTAHVDVDRARQLDVIDTQKSKRLTKIEWIKLVSGVVALAAAAFAAGYKC